MREQFRKGLTTLNSEMALFGSVLFLLLLSSSSSLHFWAVAVAVQRDPILPTRLAATRQRERVWACGGGRGGVQHLLRLLYRTRPPRNACNVSSSSSNGEGNKGASIHDIRKIFGFSDPLPLSAFGNDLYFKIHATSLTTSPFLWTYSSPLMRTSYLEAP